MMTCRSVIIFEVFEVSEGADPACAMGCVQVKLPVLVSSQDIKSGEELVVHWAKGGPAISKDPQVQTWLDQATKEMRRGQQRNK